MARTADSGTNTSRPRPDRVGRLDEVRPAFKKMLTRPDYLGLCAEEISHIGEQLAQLPQAFIHLLRIGAAFGLDHVLG